MSESITRELSKTTANNKIATIRNEFVFRREYYGPVKGLVLDWSGTTADAYVIAPARVFVEVFQNEGVEISMTEARGPMGLRKDLHIKALTETPEIAERWKEVHGTYPGQQDVDRMFAEFIPAQIACLGEYTGLLPGVSEVTQRLQDQGMRLGVSTGFTRVMVDVLLEEAIKQGFTPDATVAGDEVENGARPRPFMVYRNLDLLDLWPIESVIKVDDTIGGVGEGLNAGCWTVGMARYSNYMDINSMEEAESLPEKEIQRRLGITREILGKTGAHYVINEFHEIEAVIKDVNRRLARGEKP